MRIAHTSILVSLLFFSCSQLAIACSSSESSFERLLADTRNSVQGPFSPDDLERQNLIEIRETKNKMPFGYMNKEWLELKTAIKPGDKIYFWAFSEGRFYQDGHILVHEGCIVKTLLGKIT